uniref:Uncharacterized protein C11orf97 homolog n=1 Tax=Pogona vitticeps TaxID=103695 RepID=A0A6J0V369_9SAUR
MIASSPSRSTAPILTSPNPLPPPVGERAGPPGASRSPPILLPPPRRRCISKPGARSYGNRPARPAGLGAAEAGGGGGKDDHGEGAMTASAGDQFEPRVGDSGSRPYTEYNEGGQPWKKFVYVEPPRRVKEVLEEELYFHRDDCRVKHPSEVALERIWSLRRNFPVGAFQPALQNPSSLLSQLKYYSRHTVVRR